MEESLLPKKRPQAAVSAGSVSAEKSETRDYRLWISVTVALVAVVLAICCLSRKVLPLFHHYP